MAGTADKVFLRAFKWFRAAITHLESEVPLPALRTQLGDALRTRLGLELDKSDAAIDPSAFAAMRAAAESLALDFLRIEDEEVPRDGIELKRAFNYARDASGRALLWIGRSKTTGRGEGASGLSFDRVRRSGKR